MYRKKFFFFLIINSVCSFAMEQTPLSEKDVAQDKSSTVAIEIRSLNSNLVEMDTAIIPFRDNMMSEIKTLNKNLDSLCKGIGSFVVLSSVVAFLYCINTIIIVGQLGNK